MGELSRKLRRYVEDCKLLKLTADSAFVAKLSLKVSAARIFLNSNEFLRLQFCLTSFV